MFWVYCSVNGDGRCFPANCMNSVFEWTRQRRRLRGFDCNKNSAIKAAEYVTFGCCCNDQKTTDRQPVTEIVLTDDIICILRNDGIGKALDKSTHQEICQLNSSPYCRKNHLIAELKKLFLSFSLRFTLPFAVIRSISYNHVNNTIIFVWHSRVFNNGLSVSIHCPKRIKQVTACHSV